MLTIERHADYKPLLSETRIIAVVGMSPKESRPSNQVARYLIAAGYTVIPVNPGQTSIMGLPCFSTLLDIDHKIDMVNIFRKSEDVYPVVEDAIAIGAKSVWMQQGIRNIEAAQLAEANGVTVIMDRCIKVDHMNLFPGVF